MNSASPRLLLVLAAALLLLPCCAGTANGDDKEVRSFLEHYFASWSAQEMDAYGACFDDQAHVTFVTKEGRVDSMGLTDFLHSQRMAHQTSPVRMNEVPLEMTIRKGRLITQASVTWKLTKGAEVNTGTDYFTLIKAEGGWHIIALAFDQD